MPPGNPGSEDPKQEGAVEDSSEDEEKRKSRPKRPPKTLFRWAAEDDDEEDDEPEEVEPIATDRPDFTEASSTVGRNVLQIESGYTYLRDRDDGVKFDAHSWGEALFRYGVGRDWLELRLAVFPLSERTFDEGRSSGVEDLYLGVKLALTEQSGWLPEMALTPQMTIPTGSSRFQNEETLPGINWLYGWDVNDFLATGGSTQINKAIDDDDDEFLEFAQSWTINYTLTEQLGAYTEWFALIPSGSQSAEPQHYFDGGFTYKVTKDVQWDVRAGYGLNRAANDFFCGVGLSMRFR
jgi:hypothetical protein